MKEILVFSKSTSITFALNTFINVPVILQYEDTPLIEVIKYAKTTFTTRFPIYNQDGIYIAKVVGSRLFPTEEGKISGLTLRYPRNMTVCELNGKTLFEIKRNGPTALSLSAELFTKDGAFIRTPVDLFPQLLSRNGEEIMLKGGQGLWPKLKNYKYNTFINAQIGILLMENGSFGFGVTRNSEK
jgi:hypothetical protein